MQLNSLTVGFGTEAMGVDLANLSDADFETLWQTWLARHLLVVRAQNLTAVQFHAFARRLGQPQPHVINQFHHPDIADILILSNVIKVRPAKTELGHLKLAFA